MSFNCEQLQKFIIEPVLTDYGMNSESAVQLLLGTCAQESAFGTFLRQFPSGPALGIYQMESETHKDIWFNYINYKPFLVKKIEKEFGLYRESLDSRLVFDLRYATLLTRLHYFRISEALPNANDIDGLAKYWKKYYNTSQGKGTEEEFIENFNRFINI